MLRVVDVRAGGEVPSMPPAALDPEVVEGARAICARVGLEGDAALVDLTGRYDGAAIDGRIDVPAPERAAAAARVPSLLRGAIEAMAERLRDLHARQLPQSWTAERDGIRYGEVVRPLAAAGCYVPGGRAAYPSTVLMTAIPARVAGVGRVVVCTPPAEDGSVPDAVCLAAEVAGVDRLYRVGGAQAVAALAYGTETIEAVDTVVGPGNVWVTAAKREVMGTVGIDGLAGPTELVVVADGTADPDVLAVDLVAQAEHDPLARTTLLALDPDLPAGVEAALEAEVAGSPRGEIVEKALGEAVAYVIGGREEAMRVAGDLAPEHLQVVVEDPVSFLEGVSSFGAAFLGPRTPVVLGDYGLGSNHVLPTMRSARFSSGLRAADFVTVSSVVEASEEGAARHGPQVEVLARAEGLPGHARASEIRRA